MISLRFFALILLTLCCREIAGPVPSLDFGKSILAIAGMTIGFALMTKMVAYRLVSRSVNLDTIGMDQVRSTFLSLRSRMEGVWCISLPILLLASGWFAWMDQLHESGWPQGILVLSCFLPTVVFLALVEMTSAQVDQIYYDRNPGWGEAPERGLNASSMSDPKDSSARTGWVRHWLLRIRLGDMAGLVTCLFPVLLLASLSDVGQWAEQNLGDYWWWAKIPLAIGAVIGFIAVFPTLLTRWSGGTPAPAALMKHLQQIMARAGVRGVAPRLIPSHRRWAGAAIVGWFPKFRHLWLGDALIDGLSPQQLDMVVFHELAHVRRMHFLWRMLPVVLALIVASALWAVGAHLEMTQFTAFKFSTGLLAGLVLLIGIGAVARYCELDADRIACDIARECADWTIVRSPAEELGSALEMLLSESASQAATWLHPSLNQRLSALAQWQSGGATRGN